ncbi:MAG: polymer-forming cytoskeletal protein [Candidatus Omnitrophica bacterium]|nr:polymer-forming cytoskeletal protein [Candidatus Omnitrophota bacterium]
MRRRNKEVQEEPREKVLDVDATMQGSMTFKDPVNLRINGKFDGNLDTKGSLTIGERAVVNADINGENITIAGRVAGNVVATKSLSLVSPSYVVGDLTTPVLSVEQGSVLEGHCSMVSGKKGEAAPAPSWMTTDEIARYLEVDRTMVDEWAAGGRLPAIKREDGWRFDKTKIDEWVASEKIR